MSKYSLHFDGSCGPRNPGGTAAYGYVLLKNGEELPADTGSGVIGSGEGMTNNLAEFYALAQGLRAFILATVNIVPEWNDIASPRHVLSVYGDSRLVINIMSRRWNAKSDKVYYKAYADAQKFLLAVRRSGHTVTFDWIPREQNTLCDDLSKAHNKKD